MGFISHNYILKWVARLSMNATALELMLRWSNIRWQGGRRDKLTTKVPSPHHPLHKNADITDYDFPSVYFHTEVKLLFTMRSWSKFDCYTTFLGWRQWAVHHLAPQHSLRTCGYQATVPVKKACHFQIVRHFGASPLGPQLTKAAKQSQPTSRLERPSFLCAASPVLNHKLNKIWNFFWGFLLISILENSRTPMLVARV